MQSYRDVNDSDYISDAPAILNGNFKSIASDFRGASFPTTNLIEGMNCFRTDSSIMHQLDTDLKTWKPLYKVLTSGIEVEQAKHATNADVAETLIDALYASKTEAETGTDTTKVMTAARVKDAILKLAPKPAMASQAEAEAGVDNTKHMTPLRVLQSVLKNAPAPNLTPYAKLVSPAFTGTPTAPTAPKTTNNTQLATTAFVHALAGAVNNGGIVAQSLGQNGFVKFANGLILQWGYKSGTGMDTTIIYPIAFGTTYTVIAVPHANTLNGYMSNPCVNSVTNISFKATMQEHYQQGWYWLAYGISS